MFFLNIMGPSCVPIYFFQYFGTFMCSIFFNSFCIAFLSLWKMLDHIFEAWSIYLLVMETCFTVFPVQEQLFICGVYVSFDLGSMKNLSTGVTKLDQTQHKVRGICGRFLSCMNTYGLGRFLYIIQGTCYFEFCFVKINPKYFARMSKSHVILLYLIRQLLRQNGVPMISVHKFLGMLARNMEYANFLIIGRHGDGASLFSLS